MTFLGVILCGTTLSLLVLFYWQGLEAGGRIHRSSDLRTRGILAAMTLMDEIKERGNFAQDETVYQDRVPPLVLVSRVEEVHRDGLFWIEVRVLDQEQRELLSFETLVYREPGGDPD